MQARPNQLWQCVVVVVLSFNSATRVASTALCSASEASHVAIVPPIVSGHICSIPHLLQHTFIYCVAGADGLLCTGLVHHWRNTSGAYVLCEIACVV